VDLEERCKRLVELAWQQDRPVEPLACAALSEDGCVVPASVVRCGAQRRELISEEFAETASLPDMPGA
jgi:hypothetical protein